MSKLIFLEKNKHINLTSAELAPRMVIKYTILIINFEHVPVDVSKNFWMSGKQCRPNQIPHSVFEIFVLFAILGIKVPVSYLK